MLFILSPLLDDERCDVLLAVLVPVLLYFVLLATGSLAVILYRILTTGSLTVVLSLIISRDTFVVVYSFVDASPAPPTPPLSIAPFVIVGSRWVLGLSTCSAECEEWCGRFVAILWAVSTLITKAHIAASCHGEVRRFVRHRWRVLNPRVSLSRLVSFTVTVTVTRYSPSRVLLTFSLALHAGATHAFELC